VELLKERNADPGILESALLKLRNVYYNLSGLGVDKSAELKIIEEQLDL
jgi:hypothetical protein